MAGTMKWWMWWAQEGFGFVECDWLEVLVCNLFGVYGWFALIAWQIIDDDVATYMWPVVGVCTDRDGSLRRPLDNSIEVNLLRPQFYEIIICMYH
jgi:hypothetical protein